MFRLGVSARNPAWTWERLAEATAAQDLPWIAKGILTPEAAEAALGAGAAAIILSNHGGRQVDPAPASLDMLPEVAATVAGRVPLLLDSGVRSAADILIALALGADAVVIGRLRPGGRGRGRGAPHDRAARRGTPHADDLGRNR
jgi:4-hydroxymandelate oxidase